MHLETIEAWFSLLSSQALQLMKHSVPWGTCCVYGLTSWSHSHEIVPAGGGDARMAQLLLVVQSFGPLLQHPVPKQEASVLFSSQLVSR